MWILPRPTVTVSAVATAAKADIEDDALLANFDANIATMQTSENLYIAAGMGCDLHNVARCTSVGGVVSWQEMRDIYSSSLANEKGSARAVYDTIKAAPKWGICPICAVNKVAALDHMLPKRYYADLALAPQNLVPICDTCNKAKLTRIPRDKITQSLHPYFDTFQSAQWLSATVEQSVPVRLTFGVTAPIGWSQEQFERASFHLKAFKLGLLYSMRANQELQDIKLYVSKLHQSGGEQRVRDHLYDQYESRLSAEPNSWRTAFYKALFDSHWFSSGGFNQIA